MRKVLKITLYILGSIILLLIGVIVYLNTPGGQNFVRGKAEAFLKKKLKTELHIGHLGYGLPKYIVLEDVLFMDQANDTLLAVQELKVNIAMLQLLKKKVDVQQLVLRGVHAHIYRNMPDTNFNFTYIINAFASKEPKDTTKVKDTSSASLAINLDRVKIDDFHFHMEDQTGGMTVATDLEHLDLKMKKLDLEEMLFHIKELTISGLQLKYQQDTSYLPAKPKSNKKTKLQLQGDDIDMQRIVFNYNDNLNKFLFGLNLGGLKLQLDKFGLDDNRINVKKLALDNSDIVLFMGNRTTTPAFIDTIIKKDSVEGWHVNAKDVDLRGVSFKMDNESMPRLKSGMDFSHMFFQKTSLGLGDFLYTTDTISGRVKYCATTEQSGLKVRELRTVFQYDPQGATLKELYLNTPNTLLRDHIEVHYPSLDSLKKRTQSLELVAELQNSIIGIKDVLLFVPMLEKQELLRKNRNGHIKITTSLSGYLDNLNIKKLNLAAFSNTEIILNGRLSGLPEPKNLSYNLHITKLQSSRDDIAQVVADTVLSSIRLPDKFALSGDITGTAEDYNPDLLLVSTDGMAYIKGSLAMSPGKGKETYDLMVRADKLNIGRILKKDSLLGTVTANLGLKGQSFDIKTMNAVVAGDIAHATVKGYPYHSITLMGKVAEQKGDIVMTSADPNVRLKVDAHGDFSGRYAAARGNINIDSIDLQALNLYKSEFRARGIINFDFPELNPDYPKGTFVWRQPTITANGKRYYMDSMYVISRPSADTGQNIIADLGPLQATIRGKTPLTKIGAIVQEHIDRHNNFQKAIAKDSTGNVALVVTPKDTTTIPANYDLKVMAHVTDQPMLHSILPGLTSFDSIHIDASLTPSDLNLHVEIPDLVYDSNIVKRGVIDVIGVDSAFTYKITADQVRKGNFAAYGTNINGRLDQDKITANVSLSDRAGVEQFALKADMSMTGDTQVVRLLPGLKLNYKDWDVAQPNRIVLGDGSFYVSNFNISNSGQFLKANSVESKPNTPLNVDISNFLISNITEMASPTDTISVNGILGAAITIQKITPSPSITGDVDIQNLSVLGDTLGNLKVHVTTKSETELEAKVDLKGYGNDITLAGSYYMKPVNGNDFNMKLDVNALEVKSFETIAKREIKNSNGFVRGNLDIQGTAAAPKITGELRTDNLTTTISRLNAAFKMPNEKITFTNTGLNLNNFNILDSAGNKGTFSGTVNTTNLSNPELDMNLKAKNWRLIHSTKKDNKDYYGDLYLTSNLDVKGSPSAPRVDGSLNILKGTNFTVVTPESNPQLESRKGIVAFVNMKDTARRNVLAPKKTDSVKRKLAVGSDINVNVSVDKAAQFSLIIDQASGDFLSVKGDATLNAAVTPGGTISLTGNYDLSAGSYQFSYNFIKRKFNIQDGSSITFAGDPVKGAMLDVTAVYEAIAPAYDLVQRQVSDPAQLNYYKQRLPFDVKLHMRGPILKPILTFDIVLPENKVYPLSTDQIELIRGKLSQIRTDTSELNKQVFAILILNRFVSDDPFSSEASASVGFTALQSVSTFIGEQLNQAAGRFVKGVDISADLATTQDYTTGDMRQRTDLNLSASKRLMNDRLKLTLGNNFELEGPQQTNNAQSNYVPSNLAADYQLTSDGRYTVRGYRRAYNEGVLQGFVTETGVNFIVSVDYNKFKQIFKKKKNRSSGDDNKGNNKGDNKGNNNNKEAEKKSTDDN